MTADFFRLLIKNALTGFQITKVNEVVSAMDAFQAMYAGTFDLLLVDYQMLEINGVEFIRHVRWSPDVVPDLTIPIIMVTDFAERSVVVKARETGVNEFIGKLLEHIDLYKRILSAVHSPRSFVFSSDYRGPDRGPISGGCKLAT